MSDKRTAPPICADKRWHRHTFFEQFSRYGDGSSPLHKMVKTQAREHWVDQAVDFHEVDRWSGVLHGLPQTRYLLICRHLRASELDREIPWRPPECASATHEWICLAQHRNLEPVKPGLFESLGLVTGLAGKEKRKTPDLAPQDPAVVWFHAYHDLGYEEVARAKRTNRSLRQAAVVWAEQETDWRAWRTTHQLALLIQKISECRAMGVPELFGDYILGSLAAEPGEIKQEVDDVERFWIAAFTVILKAVMGGK